MCLEQIACGLPYCVAAAAKQERREERRFNLSVREAQRPNAHPPFSLHTQAGQAAETHKIALVFMITL